MGTLTASPLAKLAAEARGLGTETPVDRRKRVVIPSRPPRRQAKPAIQRRPSHEWNPPVAAPHEPVAPPQQVQSPAEPWPRDLRHVPAPQPPVSRNRLKREAYAEKRRMVREVLGLKLREMFPDLFCVPPVPLAIDIHKQILEISDVDPGELRIFLKYWCGRNSYIKTIYRGAVRRNIDGSPAGTPTIDHRNHAAKRLWGEWARLIDQPEE